MLVGLLRVLCPVPSWCWFCNSHVLRSSLRFLWVFALIFALIDLSAFYELCFSLLCFSGAFVDKREFSLCFFLILVANVVNPDCIKINWCVLLTCESRPQEICSDWIPHIITISSSRRQNSGLYKYKDSEQVELGVSSLLPQCPTHLAQQGYLQNVKWWSIIYIMPSNLTLTLKPCVLS